MPKPQTRRDSPSRRPSNWSKSDRRNRLPADWDKIRKRALKNDQRMCQQVLGDDGGICGQEATDVDHIRPGDDHRDSNLQSLCSMHHNRKSSGEGAKALAAKRRKIDASFSTAEDHPGIIGK